MYIKEVSSVGLEPRKSGKLVFSGYNLSLNVVRGGSTTQIGNFVKAIMFVSGITESKKLQEEGITSVEAEIVFDNSDTSGRSASNRRSHLVNVKRQVKNGTAKLMIAAINSDASLKRDSSSPSPSPVQLRDSPVNLGLGIGSPSGKGFIAILSRDFGFCSGGRLVMVMVGGVGIWDLRFSGCSTQLQAGPEKIRECSCFGNERNFNLNCVGKTVTELHTLLIDYEKGLKDKPPTPQLDTGRGTALFTSKSCEKIRTKLSTVLQLQGFKEESKLSYGEQYLQVGNAAQATIEAIGRDNDLEDDHMDTLPSENTSEIPVESKSLGYLPELIPVRRFERTTRAPNHLCLKIEVVDDEIGILENLLIIKLPCLTLIRSKWLHKKKTDMDGKVHTYKSHLVAKGCTQTYRIDYEETFSPIADVRAIRILVAIAAYYNYEIWQMDVKTAFLSGRLDENIYIEQPKGMHNSKKGYLPMEVKHDLRNELCASTPEENPRKLYWVAVKHILKYMRNTRDMFLVYGWKLDTELDVTATSPPPFTTTTLHHCSPPPPPLDTSRVIQVNSSRSSQPSQKCTWPDVAFAQNLVSRYQQNPGKLHWVGVKHILKYLRNTRDMFLVYGGKPDTELDVTGFCNASW
nr:putative retrotransposon Ty1-copia subclass protein [Tanacetum cinerariifolium]